MAQATIKEAPPAGGEKNAAAETMPAAREDAQNSEKLQEELAQLTNIQRAAVLMLLLG